MLPGKKFYFKKHNVYIQCFQEKSFILKTQCSKMELNPSLHDVDSCPGDKIELVAQVVRQVQIEGNEASISFHELSARVDSAEYKVQFSTNLKNVPLFEI